MTGIHEAKIKKLDAQPQVSQFSKMQKNHFQKSFPSKSRVDNKGRWWCQIDVMFLSACHFGQTICTQEDLPSQCLVDSHCQVSAGLLGRVAPSQGLNSGADSIWNTWAGATLYAPPISLYSRSRCFIALFGAQPPPPSFQFATMVRPTKRGCLMIQRGCG